MPDNWIEMSSWILVSMSLLGNFFVIQKNVMGQWLWTIANVGWVAYNLYNGMTSQAFLFGIYFIMSVWGILSWTREIRALQKAKAQG
ncbi:nicotinamide mononucleotide transporter [Criblamydia sequanensis]|uniref:Conserved putative membrane protein n=1 Tax=Candidatus Criblamydia sequanensis CRIB-18 TaxID=1437425 RepID=A0A090DWQ0_9BACT|nr:nicotinamide mononucleotide transporter [Criblamydia sequanensis]CDR33274.1 Conserved putative membrane protein [Criblamydia sequanensis CRIB-18]